MPTKPVAPEMMGIGGKGGGKHWTESEVKARTEAAKGTKRVTRVVMRPPPWLSDEALAVWRRVRKQIRGLELLDNLDVDMLAIYCDAVVKYKQASEKAAQPQPGDDVDETIKAVQAWARLVATYADKLGFTPAARARLVKRKADEILDEFGSEFDG